MTLTPKKYNYWRNTEPIEQQPPSNHQHQQNQFTNQSNQEQKQQQYRMQHRYNQNMKISALKTDPNQYLQSPKRIKYKKNEYYGEKPLKLIERNRNNSSEDKQIQRKSLQKQQINQFVKPFHNIHDKQFRKREQQKFQKQYVKIKAWYKKRQDIGFIRSSYNIYPNQIQNQSPAKSYNQRNKKHNLLAYNNNNQQMNRDYCVNINQQKSQNKLPHYCKNNQPYLHQLRKQHQILFKNKNLYLLKSSLNPEVKGSISQPKNINLKHQNHKNSLKRDNSPYKITNNEIKGSQIFGYPIETGLQGRQSYRYRIISYGDNNADENEYLFPKQQKFYKNKYYYH